MTTTVIEPLQTGQSIAEATCPACGSGNWKYNVTYTTIVCADHPGHRTQSHEELRCARCDKKAVMTIESSIRATDEFKQVRRQEDQYA